MGPTDFSPKQRPLPKCWPQTVGAAILHAISLAHLVITYARGWAANSLNARVRQAAEIDRLQQVVALLQERLALVHARLSRIQPHRWPRYTPVERMRVLELKAARGWSLSQTAKAMLLDPQTPATWMKRLDEKGSNALVRRPTPVNRFPEFVRKLVPRLKLLCPTLGKVKIAQVLARAGLHLGPTTVGRVLKEDPSQQPPADTMGDRAGTQQPETPTPDQADTPRVVTAKHPNHVWHVDRSMVPTVSGFWTPWSPFALPQVWPFCWWVAVAMDHFARRVMAVGIWKKAPTSALVRHVLGQVRCRSTSSATRLGSSGMTA